MCILHCFLQCFLLLDNAALGGGRGGQEQLFLRMMFSAFVHLHWFLQCFSRFRTLVFFAVFSGFMTSLMLRHAGVGGDVNVPCNLLTLLMLRHAGVGGDVNVPCNLLTLWMLRHAGVGDVNVPCNLLTLLMLRHAGVGGC